MTQANLKNTDAWISPQRFWFSWSQVEPRHLWAQVILMYFQSWEPVLQSYAVQEGSH